MDLPLSGIRILDISRLMPGAYATQMMADFGADVIKVREAGYSNAEIERFQEEGVI